MPGFFIWSNKIAIFSLQESGVCTSERVLVVQSLYNSCETNDRQLGIRRNNKK